MSKPAPSLAPGRFADVSSITPAGPGRFEAEVHPDWTLGGKPNGGYLLAMLGRAAEAAGPHQDVIAASAHYLRSPEPGMVSVEAEVLRAGRGASQVRARMVQRNQACIEALITTSRIDATAKPYWDRGCRPWGPPPSATVSGWFPARPMDRG
jgi:acyl-coenzyme A thioesterase PaaI-like protein